MNPRLASQLADLYQRVDGISPFRMLLDLATGVEPEWPPGAGRFKTAASFVFRRFDGTSPRLRPSRAQRQWLKEQFPDAQLFFYLKRGASLAREMKWLGSHRYATLNLGGENRQYLEQRYRKVCFGGGRRNQPQRGDDISYDLKITLEDAASGLEKDIDVYHQKTCPVCHGSRAEPGTHAQTCPTCGGSGQVRHVNNTPLGQFATIRPCKNCRGEGKIIENPCKECRGKGIIKQKNTIHITIPPGVEDGSRLRVAGEGDVGKRSGPPGDLYVLIRVKPHKLFQREGANLIYKMPISFVQASLGDTIQVPTLDGAVDLKIPSGTQTGTSFRIKGHGMPHSRWNGKGNLYVKVKIVTPKKLSPKQKELLQEFAEIRGYFDRIRRSLKCQLETIRQNEYQIKDHLDHVKRLIQQKDEFVSLMAHELKTPLVPITWDT